jgi:hypothetical protein
LKTTSRRGLAASGMAARTLPSTDCGIDGNKVALKETMGPEERSVRGLTKPW